MASVWQAYHLTLDTEVAIKFLEPRWSGSDEISSRFAREATAIARIRSPHVIHVLDYGFTERGRGFIVMELLRGEDLGRRLARTGRLSIGETVTLVTQACRGLGKAHAANIIHRDIKPENLFLVFEEEGFFVKLLDFGVAKAIGASDAIYQTDTGQIVGTPLYMSPEQARGRTIDGRCDLYSLATVAYRCLTGRPPFIEKHVGELLVAISTLVPPPASSFEQSLPASVDAWFASMFSKDPNARCCQAVRELATSFEAACNGVSLSSRATPGTSTVGIEAEAPTQPGDSDGRETPQSGRRGRDATPAPMSDRPFRESLRSTGGRGRTALSLAAIVIGVGGLAVWTQRRPRATTGSSAATADLPLRQQPAPAPRTIELRFEARPSTAALFVDGRPLPSNPFKGAVPLDNGKHRLRAEAAGYVPLDTELTFDHDVQLELSLVAMESPEAILPPSAEGGAPNVSRGLEKKGREGVAPKTPLKEHPSIPVALPEAPEKPSPRKPPLELDRSSPWRDP